MLRARSIQRWSSSSRRISSLLRPSLLVALLLLGATTLVRRPSRTAAFSAIVVGRPGPSFLESALLQFSSTWILQFPLAVHRDHTRGSNQQDVWRQNIWKTKRIEGPWQHHHPGSWPHLNFLTRQGLVIGQYCRFVLIAQGRQRSSFKALLIHNRDSFVFRLGTDGPLNRAAAAAVVVVYSVYLSDVAAYFDIYTRVKYTFTWPGTSSDIVSAFYRLPSTAICSTSSSFFAFNFDKEFDSRQYLP